MSTQAGIKMKNSSITFQLIPRVEESKQDNEGRSTGKFDNERRKYFRLLSNSFGDLLLLGRSNVLPELVVKTLSTEFNLLL